MWSRLLVIAVLLVVGARFLGGPVVVHRPQCSASSGSDSCSGAAPTCTVGMRGCKPLVAFAALFGG